jgi:hypothetical protein
MQHRPIETPQGASSWSPAQRDHQLQAAVVAHVLFAHPSQLTQGELIRELTSASEDFAATDEIHRAVRDLVAVGLLHRQGTFVVPSRAAARFHELMVV